MTLVSYMLFCCKLQHLHIRTLDTGGTTGNVGIGARYMFDHPQSYVQRVSDSAVLCYAVQCQSAGYVSRLMHDLCMTSCDFCLCGVQVKVCSCCLAGLLLAKALADKVAGCVSWVVSSVVWVLYRVVWLGPQTAFKVSLLLPAKSVTAFRSAVCSDCMLHALLCVILLDANSILPLHVCE